jgi:hypothetical protein
MDRPRSMIRLQVGLRGKIIFRSDFFPRPFYLVNQGSMSCISPSGSLTYHHDGVHFMLPDLLMRSFLPRGTRGRKPSTSAPGGYAKLARLTARGPLSFRVRVVYWRKYHSEYTGFNAEGRPGCQHHSDVSSNRGLKTSIRVDRTLNIKIILFSSKHI